MLLGTCTRFLWFKILFASHQSLHMVIIEYIKNFHSTYNINIELDCTIPKSVCLIVYQFIHKCYITIVFFMFVILELAHLLGYLGYFVSVERYTSHVLFSFFLSIFHRRRSVKLHCCKTQLKIHLYFYFIYQIITNRR